MSFYDWMLALHLLQSAVVHVKRLNEFVTGWNLPREPDVVVFARSAEHVRAVLELANALLELVAAWDGAVGR